MVKRKIIYVTVLLVVGFVFNTTKINASSAQSDIERIIKDIREEYKKINSDTNLVMIEKDLTGLSTEGGVLFSFYDNVGLRKSVLTFYGEMGKKVDEYYFKEGKLIFLFTQESHYNQPIYIEDGFKIERTEENRYYFCDERLVRWIDAEKKMRDIYADESKSISSEIINNAAAILNLKKDKSFAFSGSGKYEFKAPVSYITQTLILKYDFYKLPDQLYIEDQLGNILFNTDMVGTNGEKVKKITLSKVENVKVLVFKVNTQKPNSRWKFSIELE